MVSFKSAIVVLWVCLVAGAAIASENHRLCSENATAENQRLHKLLKVHEDETEVLHDVLIVAEVDVTN